jgi:hypothetical protein
MYSQFCIFYSWKKVKISNQNRYVSMIILLQKLSENLSVNRMDESLKLFSSVCNVRWFTRAALILFLNKRDIFAEKIKRKPLKDFFPSYEGGDNYEVYIYLFNIQLENR